MGRGGFSNFLERNVSVYMGRRFGREQLTCSFNSKRSRPQFLWERIPGDRAASAGMLGTEALLFYPMAQVSASGAAAAECHKWWPCGIGIQSLIVLEAKSVRWRWDWSAAFCGCEGDRAFHGHLGLPGL